MEPVGKICMWNLCVKQVCGTCMWNLYVELVYGTCMWNYVKVKLKYIKFIATIYRTRKWNKQIKLDNITCNDDKALFQLFNI